MQRSELPDPVVADHRRLTAGLHDVDGEVLAQDRDVDRLTQRAGQPVGQRLRLLGQLQLHVDPPGEPDLTARVRPSRETVKLGRQARFDLTVRNRGDAAAQDVQSAINAAGSTLPSTCWSCC